MIFVVEAKNIPGMHTRYRYAYAYPVQAPELTEPVGMPVQCAYNCMHMHNMYHMHDMHIVCISISLSIYI